MQWAIGLDPSLTRTGVFAIGVAGVGERERLEWSHFGSQPREDSGLASRFSRYGEMARNLRAWVAETCGEGRSVQVGCVEGYAFSAKWAARACIELGCVYRTILLQVCHEVVEVPPSSLKKFATKNGAASKAQVRARVENEFGVDLPNEDVSDAAACAWVGAVCAGLIGAAFELQSDIAQQVGETV